MSKYGDDIRRIARWKDTKDPSNTKPDTRGDIGGERGIAYKEETGNTDVAKQSVVPSISDALQKGTSDALADSGIKTDNLANGEIDESTGNVEDLIDGNTEESNDPNYELKPFSDFTDIVTGEPVQVRLDGGYIAPGSYTDASGNTLNWEHIDSPPTDPAYVSGAFFTGSTYSTSINVGYDNSYSEIVERVIQSNPDGGPFTEWVAVGPNPLGPPDAADLAGRFDENSPVTYFFRHEDTTNPASYFQTQITMFGCDASSAGLVAVKPAGCGTGNATVNRLPVGSLPVISLQDDGLFKSSQYDKSEVGQAYKEGVSIFVGKFSGGTRNAVIEQGAGNTLLIYEVDSNGIPTGTVRQYTKSLIDKLTPDGSIVTKSNKFVKMFPASEINNYRLIQNIQRIRLGGVGIK